jgi:hypothetical protein
MKKMPIHLHGIMAVLEALLCFEATPMFSNYKEGNANVTTGHICKGGWHMSEDVSNTRSIGLIKERELQSI